MNEPKLLDNADHFNAMESGPLVRYKEGVPGPSNHSLVVGSDGLYWIPVDRLSTHINAILGPQPDPPATPQAECELCGGCGFYFAPDGEGKTMQLDCGCTTPEEGKAPAPEARSSPKGGAATVTPREGDARMLLARIVRASNRETMTPSMVALLEKAGDYLSRTESDILREVPPTSAAVTGKTEAEEALIAEVLWLQKHGLRLDGISEELTLQSAIVVAGRTSESKQGE